MQDDVVEMLNIWRVLRAKEEAAGCLLSSSFPAALAKRQIALTAR